MLNFWNSNSLLSHSKFEDNLLNIQGINFLN